MCSLLPDLLAAKRRLRLSSQYSRCQTARVGNEFSTQNKRPLEGDPLTLAFAVKSVSFQRGAVLRKMNFPLQHLFLHQPAVFVAFASVPANISEKQAIASRGSAYASFSRVQSTRFRRKVQRAEAASV